MSNRGEPGDEDYQAEQRGVDASGLTAAKTPPLQSPADEMDFDVVETDDRGEPIGGHQPEPQDTRLTTEAAGEQPLIRPEESAGGQPAKPNIHQPRSSRRRAQRDARAESDRQRIELEAKLNEANQRLAQLETGFAGVQPRLVELGGQPTPGTPADFGKFIAAETDKWGKVVREAGLKSG